MSDEKLSLQAGIAYMDRCFDAELNAQRSIAHSAIDMDDWGKAQEILQGYKEAIQRVETLRAKFAEFKKIVEEGGALPAVESAAQDNAPQQSNAEESSPEQNAPKQAEAGQSATPQAAPEAAAAEQADSKDEGAKTGMPELKIPGLEDEKPNAEKSFVDGIEELIEKYPYPMAVCYSAPNMNKFFSMDEVMAKSDFKKPVQLSNDMWVETAIPEDKAKLLTEALRKYCEGRKQG